MVIVLEDYVYRIFFVDWYFIIGFDEKYFLVNFLLLE